MGKPSVLMKILIPVLGVAIILVISYRSRMPARPASAESAQSTKPNVEPGMPSCTTGSPVSADHAVQQNGVKQHSVTLSWVPSTPVSDSPADAIKGYLVYRSPSSQTYTEKDKLNSVPLTSTRCVDATVSSRATYYYVVKAVAENGAQSVASKELKAVIPFP